MTIERICYVEIQSLRNVDTWQLDSRHESLRDALNSFEDCERCGGYRIKVMREIEIECVLITRMNIKICSTAYYNGNGMMIG